MWIKWLEKEDHKIIVSLLWFVIMNKLHASVLGGLYTPGVGSRPFQHSCSIYSSCSFFSVCVGPGQEGVFYPSPSNNWPLLCNLDPGLSFHFSLRQRSFNSFSHEWIFFPGSGNEGEGFLPFLRNRYFLHHHFPLTRRSPGPLVWEGLLPFPQWLTNLFYMRHGSREASSNLPCSASGHWHLSEQWSGSKTLKY